VIRVYDSAGNVVETDERAGILENGQRYSGKQKATMR